MIDGVDGLTSFSALAFLQFLSMVSQVPLSDVSGDCDRGGPLSPYPFIPVVNVLSCILKLAYEGGFVQKVGPGTQGSHVAIC